MRKRIFDFTCSLIGLAVLWPLFLIVAVLIKATSEGPVFYRGERIGRYGRYFRIYKFRTMVKGAERLGGPSTSADDPRLTKIGAWIKKYKIDELPQLLNVMKGEMAIVGPRPEVKEYINLMKHYTFRAVCSIRPGITDFASLWNFREEEMLRGRLDPDEFYRKHIRPYKVKLQMKYFNEKSFATDLKIIGRTVLRVFK